MFKTKLVNMNIGIIGYGKMGKAIEEIAIQKGHQITLKINSQNKGDLKIDNILNLDVAIEFSNPNSAFNNIQFCLQNNIPVVSGTTGWLNQIEKVKKTCIRYNGSFLYAPNFSIGTNIFFKINNYINNLMNTQNYKISIEEKHHIMKKDKPSGTAIKIQNDIYQNMRKLHTKNTEKIPIISKRMGQIKGEHIVKYFSEIEEIKISHKALSRKGFAEGALLGAEFIYDKTGIFTMDDIINNL